METGEALSTLGLGFDATFEDMRAAYREALLRHHPDVDASPDAADRTAAIVTAFRYLREETSDGTVMLTPVSTQSLEPTGNDAPIVLLAGPGDVFQRLLEATEAIAEISYADRQGGLLQALVSVPGFEPCQLSAEVDLTGRDAQVLFTLEPLRSGLAPDLGYVVSQIAPYL